MTADCVCAPGDEILEEQHMIGPRIMYASCFIHHGFHICDSTVAYGHVLRWTYVLQLALNPHDFISDFERGRSAQNFLQSAARVSCDFLLYLLN